MIGSAQQSALNQLINEVPSHVFLVNNKVGAILGPNIMNMPKGAYTNVISRNDNCTYVFRFKVKQQKLSTWSRNENYLLENFL